MICEMCGVVEAVYRARVEGAEIAVCHKCSAYGTVLGPYQTQEKLQQKRARSIQDSQPQEEVTEMVVNNYSELLRKKRESMEITQKEFAQRLNEKESVIHKLESGAMQPSLAMAKKLQRFLRVKLTVEYKESHETADRTKTEEFTLGDFIKKKK